jgi:putative flippase GtrA
MRRTDVGRSVFNREFLRQGIYFVLSGGLNTLATYLLYLLLLNFLHYQIAYATSFIAGILLSYVLSTRFVFRTTHSWVKFSLFPLVYLISYAAGAAVLALSVNRLGIDQRIAPLVSACVTLPLSFVLSRLILVPPTKPRARR